MSVDGCFYCVSASLVSTGSCEEPKLISRLEFETRWGAGAGVVVIAEWQLPVCSKHQHGIWLVGRTQPAPGTMESP